MYDMAYVMFDRTTVLHFTVCRLELEAVTDSILCNVPTMHSIDVANAFHVDSKINKCLMELFIEKPNFMFHQTSHGRYSIQFTIALRETFEFFMYYVYLEFIVKFNLTL